MAVVESAADSLSLTLGLAMPRNFSHLSPSSDADLDQQQQKQQQQQHEDISHQQQEQFLQQLQFLQQTQTQQHEISQVKQLHLDADREIKTDASLQEVSITSLANGNGTGLAGSASESRQIVESNEQISVSETLIEQQKPISGNGDLVSRNAAGAGKNPQAFDMGDLDAALPKLNPLAKEFVPSSVLSGSGGNSDPANSSNSGNRKKKNNYPSGKRRLNNRANKAQLEECVRRTVYVSDIDQQVTEEQLAALFLTCGQVVDCRVCGDPNSVLRFAFVEFTREEEARAALNLAGTMLGFYPVRVLPSKTAILPVNPTFLPRSENEREMCARTVYCTNIDKKVSQAEVKLFFETLCGEVARLRLLGDYRHSTRIAFVEFVQAESAMLALNCSGAILGSLPLRVSPSKTPVRPRSPRLLQQ